MNIKDLVKNGKQVTFMYYCNGELWYRHEEGFEFPVPIIDVGEALMLSNDKALFFMRYIRKHHEMLETARANA